MLDFYDEEPIWHNLYLDSQGLYNSHEILYSISPIYMRCPDICA